MPEKEEQLDQILEQDSVIASTPKEQIIYYRPKFHRRVLANFIDILIFAILFVSFFALDRFIVDNTATYKNNFNQYDSIRLDSGIYARDGNNQISDIITILNSNSAYNNQYKKQKSKEAIDQFLTYANTVCSVDDYKYMAKDYDDFRMNSDMIYKNASSAYNNTPLFVKDGDEVVENPVLLDPEAYVPNIYGYYYNNAYTPYIDGHLQGFLTTRIPGYYELVKYFALTLIFADIVPAYLFTGILVYYIPTICFTRGRTTLGKAIYRIGLVDSRVLSPTFARTTAKFAIFYFAELILSVVTFGIPYLISFSMMVFTKGKQSFPEYMLGLTEIDMSRTKIYKSFQEADLDKINSHKEPVNFRVPNFD